MPSFRSDIRVQIKLCGKRAALVDQYVSGYDELTGFLARDVRLQNPGSPEARQALQQLDQAYEYERIPLAWQHSRGKEFARSFTRLMNGKDLHREH